MSRNLFIITIILILSILILSSCESKKEEKSRTTLDYAKLNESILDYLQNDFESPNYGGKIFCAYELYGNEIKNERVYIYLWIHCMEYYFDQKELKRGSGISIPIVLIGLPLREDYKIIDHKRPMSGEDWGRSIKETFPEKYQKDLHPGAKEYNRRADSLSKVAEEKAKMYYKLK